MDSLKTRLERARQVLRTVETRVRDTCGREWREQRDHGGFFRPAPEYRKRRRPGDPRDWPGFIVDLKPDMQVAEVKERLFVGSQDPAADCDVLRSHGVTHIVNAATGVDDFYPDLFTYIRLRLYDLPSESIVTHFERTNRFIAQALDGGGCVFVHCNAGISRSTTIVIAYLMWHDHLSLEEAFESVRRVRPCAAPNIGFWRQLQDYERRLKQNGAPSAGVTSSCVENKPEVA